MIVRIYCLKDPITNLVVYIGQTKQLLYERLKGHLAELRHSKKKAWIDDLKGNLLEPIIELIENTDEDNARVREAYWIAYYYNLGHRLFNQQEYIKLQTFDEFEWFKRNNEFITLSKIEKDLGMPQSTLNKALKGRGLPNNWHEPFKKWVNDFLAD